MLLIAERIHHVGRDAFHQEHIRPDGAAGADDGIATHDGSTRIDGDVVFDRGVTLLALERLARSQRASDEANTLIELHMLADLTGLANDHASAVIDEEVRADLRPRMDVDASAAMRPLRHHARQQWHLGLIQPVRDTLHGDGFQPWVCQDDFL